MSRTVFCRKLQREAPGLELAPYPGEIGARIWREISAQAWANWQAIQIRLVNEHQLSLADPEARQKLREKMLAYLFEDQAIEADGYTPPEK